MICPYCNREMEKGFIQCRDGLHWTPKKQKIAALSGMGKGAVLIGSEDGLVPNTFAVAYHCGECKFVMIPYGKGEGNRD